MKKRYITPLCLPCKGLAALGIKTFRLIMSMSLILTVAVPLSASAHYCRFKRGDSKYICLAKQEETLYFCRYVKNKDSQRTCVAGFYGKKTYCAGIKGSEQKARCESDADARAIILDKRRAQAEAQKAAQEAAQQQASGQAPSP